MGNINTRVAFFILQLNRKYKIKIIQGFAPISDYPVFCLNSCNKMIMSTCFKNNPNKICWWQSTDKIIK